MAVGIDQARNYRASSEVDHLSSRTGKFLYFFCTSDLQEFPVLDRNSGSCCTCSIKGDDFRIVINYIRCSLGQGH